MPSSRPRGQETTSLFLSFAVSLFLRLSSSLYVLRLVALSHVHRLSERVVVSSAQETIHYGDRPAYLVAVRSARGEVPNREKLDGRGNGPRYGIVIRARGRAMTDDARSETHVTEEKERDRERKRTIRWT